MQSANESHYSRPISTPAFPARLQETIYARKQVPSPMDYQYFSILDNSRIPGPKCLSLSTFGCSPRPVLSPVNFTAAGKIAGFATHRRPSGLSPRPGPGAHATQRIDKKGRGLWLATSSAEDSELDRLKPNSIFSTCELRAICRSKRTRHNFSSRGEMTCASESVSCLLGSTPMMTLL